jgi:uncharacterized protein
MSNKSQVQGTPYNSYGRFLREKFGCRVYKISVDAGFRCPNRDGFISTGGCAYCNNDSFRPPGANSANSVSEQIQTGMEFLRKRFRAEKFIAYFQPSTNTYAPLETLIPVYQAAIESPDVVGISIGTRPDCVDEEKIAWLQQLAQTHFVTIEYGLQSVYDETLERINRGHDFQCWQKAMAMTRNRGIWLGTHLILGFPWETREQVLNEADILSNEDLNFIKLHHLHIVKNSALAVEYQENPFPLLSLEDYADLVVEFIRRLNPQIYIERLFATAPNDLLIAPLWGKSKAEIQHYIEKKLAVGS